MKANILLPLYFTLLIFNYIDSSSLKAQEITSFEISPEYPASTDEILLIVGTNFPMLGCSLDSVVIYYACGAYALDGFYNTDFDPGNCDRTDTISLGSIANGGYALTYRMYYLGWSEVDKIDTFFTVGTTGIERFAQKEEEVIRVWPNPSHGTVHFSVSENNIDALHISSASGAYQIKLDISDDHTALNSLSLQPGMYICSATRNGRRVYTSKFIVLE